MKAYVCAQTIRSRDKKGGIAMPAALTVDTVDQSLVDSFLERVDRFVDNVDRFQKTLAEMKENLMDKFAPASPEVEEPVHEEIAAAAPEQDVVTADDIDLDALLAGVDLGGVEMDM